MHKDNKRIVVPMFQRGKRWKKAQEQKFIDSLIKGYPVGTMLFYETYEDMATGSNQHRHNGRCNGDCANGPPHYGYRYGRWYYGHDHVHGCEFGDNKGSGSMD